MVRPIPAIAFTLILTACSTGSLGLSTNTEGRYAPSVDPKGTAVDPLLVGDRLMAAEEYELAYQSYIRAAATQGMTAEILIALGSASLQLGRLIEAENLLRRALDQDDSNAAAWNNLGVVLMSNGDFAEARQVFRRAFVVSGGSSAEIRENLRLAIANLENPTYDAVNDNDYKLVQRGKGDFLITASE
jgi:Flp pilus assembly protein TadD